jgi:hypothetical protein
MTSPSSSSAAAPDATIADYRNPLAALAARSLDAATNRVEIYGWTRDEDPARLLLAVAGVGEAILALNETLSTRAPEPPRRRWFPRRAR